MAYQDSRAKVLRAAGAASVAAPYVRRIMSDDELRGDLRTLVIAARHLIEGLTESGPSKLLDDDVRKDLDRMIAALQGAGDRVVHVHERSTWGRWVIAGAVIGGTIAGLLIYPTTRRQMMRAVGMSQGDAWIDTTSGNGAGTEEHDRSEMAA